jgi:iron complex outermembrane recepter protein
MTHHLAKTGALIVGVALSADRAVAQDTATTKLPPMVTVTRQAPRSPFDLPFGISTVSPDSLRPGQAHIAADQTLMMIPGLTVANRSNPSQDVRVSVRGFGARSAFGVRSIRVIRDGMPLTLPDGQTPLDYLDLESVGRIEVIRGAASALYGNASGGVIDIHSIEPTANVQPEARAWMGSNATRRTSAVVSGTTDGYSYQGNVGQTAADNYRAFSHQRLTNGFARLSTTLGGTALSLVGLGLHMPLAENPGALTQAQLDSAPQMADPQSVAKRARKEVDQLQIGLSARRQVGPGPVSVAAYGGTRSLYNPQTFAVVDVGRTTAGASVRGDFDIAAVAGLRLTVGGDYQRQDDARKNWANCNALAATTASCPSITVEKGVLQLDQRELVTGGGPYARLELERGRVSANAGARSDVVRFELDDHFLSDGRDDSGVRTLHAVSPMAGLAVRLSRFSSVYANFSTAFETPTTTELGNHPDGSAGLNPNLLPQYSRTVEAGAKGIAASVLYEISLFRTGVRDELIQFQVPGGNGRMYFGNAGRTRRDGVEFAGEWSTAGLGLGPGLDLNWAYAYSHFRFVDFVSGTVQLAGKQIPGIPIHQLQLSATRRFNSGGFAVAEWAAKSSVWANDANTVSAKRFDVLNVRAGRDVGIGHAVISPMLAVNNALDRHYAGSVVINATAAGTAAPKFFEPSPGRTWLAGARVMLGR